MPRKANKNQNREKNNLPTDTSHTEDHSDVLSASKEETCSDTGSEVVNCSHARHYKQPAQNKKKGKQHTNSIILSLKCLDCVRDKAESVETPDLWLCLYCFHSRCGRYTDNRHAVVHFEANKEHCLSLNTVNLQVWCYECDNYVLIKGKLESTVASMRTKLKSIKPPKPELPMEIEMVEFPVESVKTGKCSSIRVIGLSNLGNTCYFNSALQNLLYLAPFKEQLFSTLHRTEYSLVPKKHPDLDPITFQYTNNGAAEPGDLTLALSSLIKLTKQVDEQDLIRAKKSAHKRFSTTPRAVQNVIARKHRKFSNGSQQDSHELLRYLIDMVKDEEIKRLKTAFLEHFDAKDHKSQFKNYSEEKKKLLRKYASEFKNIFVFTGTFIDEVFGGKLLSIVECHTCRNTFDVNEDFLDLSLPLPVEKYDPRPKYGNDDTKKQKKQVVKAEKKRLKKQNSKTYDIHTFNKKSDFPDTGMQDRGSSREETGSKKPADNRGDKVDTNGDKVHESSPIIGSQDRDSDQHLSNDMNGLNIDTPTGQPLETKLDNLEGERVSEDQIPESIPDDNLREEVTEPHSNLPIIIIDKYDCRADNSAEDGVSGTDSSQIVVQDTPTATRELQLQSNPQTDLPMEVEPAESDLSPHSTASHSETAEQPNEREECTVKSKRLKRLKAVDKTEYQQSSLEYYVNKFFSAETLHGDYLCVRCNPQFMTGDDEDKESISGRDGEGEGEGEGKDERENSGESIDLTKCHFSDATKQFHVKSLPPILTIHLKRFSQSGFRLHKVNKHIEFPLVLDMAPFCTSDVAATVDSDLKILYGLRGIVQHSGGLIAGHYIAYVNIADWRGHTDIKSPQTQPDSSSGNDVTSTTQCEKMDTDSLAEIGEETRDCGIQVSTKDPAAEKQSHEPTCQPTTHTTPSEDWYYISDSSVSKVSSYEVFRSQAYILFYERLPLEPKPLLI